MSAAAPDISSSPIQRQSRVRIPYVSGSFSFYTKHVNYDESTPKDYDAYADKDGIGGSQFKSTHKRLGTWVDNEMLTESGVSQRAALSEPRGTPARRALVNLLTFPETLGEHRKKNWSECGIRLPPVSADCTDYNSTYQTDYLNFFPERPKTISREELMKPETKFRRLLVDGADQRRPGLNTFYDDNMDYLKVRCKERSLPPFAFHYTPRVI